MAALIEGAWDALKALGKANLDAYNLSWNLRDRARQEQIAAAQKRFAKERAEREAKLKAKNGGRRKAKKTRKPKRKPRRS